MRFGHLGEARQTKILVLGAVAIGGYSGGRLVHAGGDVAFLVREGGRAQLAERHLVVRSPHGDFEVLVDTVTQAEHRRLREAR